MKLLSDESGQALIEFVLFLPTFVFIYAVIIIAGNSINASINQEKITRGYFYNLVHHDSRTPNQNIISMIASDEGLRQVSLYGVGWCSSRNKDTPIAPCYRMIRFKDGTEEEACTPGKKGGNTTQFIRPKTAYGVCGATYDLTQGLPTEMPQSSQSSCTNT